MGSNQVQDPWSMRFLVGVQSPFLGPFSMAVRDAKSNQDLKRQTEYSLLK